MTDFSHEDFLAIELQERLRSLSCNVPYEMARQQVQSFVAAEARAIDVSPEEFLAGHADEDLVARWVEQVMTVATHLSEEVEEQYPLLAMPLGDAGSLIAMLSTTLDALYGVEGYDDIAPPSLQVLASLGKQIALPELPSDLCLLTQIDTFALSVAVRHLMALPPDVTCEPHMEWVEGCADVIDSCFEQIAVQQGRGDDLFEPEQRVFVISLTEEPVDE